MPSPELLIAACMWIAPAPVGPELRVVQVSPYLPAGNPFQRTPKHTRAVVLIHGLRPHVLSAADAERPDFSSWERPDSKLVQLLATESDVFAVGYAQTCTVDDLAGAAALREGVVAIQRLGFTDIVMVGHSAGGLIARQYVEDQPGGGGVTRVVQVCAPNGGSGWGQLAAGVRACQTPFIRSLTKEARQERARVRRDVALPATVEFVCLVGSVGVLGDGVVRHDCQWPADLQAQGVPAVRYTAHHSIAMMTGGVQKQIAELCRVPAPRWSETEVAAAKKKLLGE